jgi:hypothetical protein
MGLAAFFIWFWKRRVVKKRRSTLLTPLSIDPGEKDGYVITRGSIGPTPMAEKLRAAVNYNVGKIRTGLGGIFPGGRDRRGVNMDRGNSQFMDPVSTHSRNSSSVMSSPVLGRSAPTSKGGIAGWWTGVTGAAAGAFAALGRPRKESMSSVPFTAARNEPNEKGMGKPQTDFLTLLSMDDGQLDQEAQRRRLSVNRRTSSTGSAGSFFGGLNLNFSDDPFSDINSLAHTSAKPAPLNPFSDSNAIPKPATYVADIRRSRGASVSAPRAPSTVYRDSVSSVESFATRRNKFRSDPFDLERPELLANARQAKVSITSSTAATAASSDRSSRLSGGVGTGDIRRPAGAHHRTESFTSKYSSGASLGDWSDPGPDVGPAASRTAAWEGPEPRESPTQGWRNRQEKEAAAAAGKQKRGSGWSVGKAM